MFIERGLQFITCNDLIRTGISSSLFIHARYTCCQHCTCQINQTAVVSQDEFRPHTITRYVTRDEKKANKLIDSNGKVDHTNGCVRYKHAILFFYHIIVLQVSVNHITIIVTLYMEGSICLLTKWQIHSFISKTTSLSAQSRQYRKRMKTVRNMFFTVHNIIDSTAQSM